MERTDGQRCVRGEGGAVELRVIDNHLLRVRLRSLRGWGFEVREQVIEGGPDRTGELVRKPRHNRGGRLLRSAKIVVK